jgi:hypothetical protein
LRIKEKHAIAVAEKTVLLLHGMGVSGQHAFSSRECADEHQKRGFWKVKVGEKAADDLKFAAGAEEDIGLAGVRCQRLALSDLGAVLECAGGGGAGGDDAISRL